MRACVPIAAFCTLLLLVRCMPETETVSLVHTPTVTVKATPAFTTRAEACATYAEWRDVKAAWRDRNGMDAMCQGEAR